MRTAGRNPVFLQILRLSGRHALDIHPLSVVRVHREVIFYQEMPNSPRTSAHYRFHMV